MFNFYAEENKINVKLFLKTRGPWTKYRLPEKLFVYHFILKGFIMNLTLKKYSKTLYFKILPYIKQYIKRSLLFGTSYHKKHQQTNLNILGIKAL